MNHRRSDWLSSTECFSPPYIPNTYVGVDGWTRQVQEHNVLGMSIRMNMRDDYRSNEAIEILCLPGYKDARLESIRAICKGSVWQNNLLKCEREFYWITYYNIVLSMLSLTSFRAFTIASKMLSRFVCVWNGLN